jgi:DNA-binding NtrC family response regulator
MIAPRAARLLIVEDLPSLAASCESSLSARADSIRCVASSADAFRALREWDPDLMLLDVTLPDGTAFDVLREARALVRMPQVVAMSGSAGPEESFRLAQLGVRTFLSKPVTRESLEQAVTEALQQPPDLIPHLRATVGSRGVHAVEEEVRKVMVTEALARCRGSRRKAAGVLAISRQLLQHILRRDVA